MVCVCVTINDAYTLLQKGRYVYHGFITISLYIWEYTMIIQYLILFYLRGLWFNVPGVNKCIH